MNVILIHFISLYDYNLDLKMELPIEVQSVSNTTKNYLERTKRVLCNMYDNTHYV